MKEADIRKYAGLMEELGLTGLEITEDNQVVRLERILQSAPTMPMLCPQPIPQEDPAGGERRKRPALLRAARRRSARLTAASVSNRRW